MNEYDKCIIVMKNKQAVVNERKDNYELRTVTKADIIIEKLFISL
jgi:hypothetical protein